MQEIIKHLTGYSGHTILLMRDNNDNVNFVRKIGDNTRNLQNLHNLKSIGISVPEIIDIKDDYYDMQYIPHMDITNWLTNNNVDILIEWIKHTISLLNKNSAAKNYYPIYSKKLEEYTEEFKLLNFTVDELLRKLPKILPQSNYHGDLTLDNILYGTNNKFYTIDPLTSVYDSWVFDLQKLRQDLQCKWFIRNKGINLDSKLAAINDSLKKEYEHYSNDYLLILMMLRILPYAKNEKDKQWIITEINTLWK